MMLKGRYKSANFGAPEPLERRITTYLKADSDVIAVASKAPNL